MRPSRNVTTGQTIYRRDKLNMSETLKVVRRFPKTFHGHLEVRAERVIPRQTAEKAVPGRLPRP